METIKQITSLGSFLDAVKDLRNEFVEKPQFIIDRRDKKALAGELRQSGITRASLFPDLQNITMSIVEESKDWKDIGVK